MFNIGFGELIVLMLVAFLVVGPKDLPNIARAAAKGLRQLRALLGDLKQSVGAEEERACLKEMTQTLAEARQLASEASPVRIVKKELAGLDPMAELKEEISSLNPLAGAKEELKSLNPLAEAKKELEALNPKNISSGRAAAGTKR